MKKNLIVFALISGFLLSIIPACTAAVTTGAENKGHHGFLSIQAPHSGVFSVSNQSKKNDKTGKILFDGQNFVSVKYFKRGKSHKLCKKAEGFKLFWILLPVNVRK